MINEETVIEYINHELSKRLSPSFNVTVSSDRVIGKGNQFYITVCIQDAFTIRDDDIYHEVNIAPTVNKSINTIISTIESVSTHENNNLLEFLDIMGNILNSQNDYIKGDNLWDECAEQTDISDYIVGDWVEVAPAMKGLAAMIRSGVFK